MRLHVSVELKHSTIIAVVYYHGSIKMFCDTQNTGHLHVSQENELQNLKAAAKYNHKNKLNKIIHKLQNF